MFRLLTTVHVVFITSVYNQSVKLLADSHSKWKRTNSDSVSLVPLMEVTI